jgi:hypothetical protein
MLFVALYSTSYENPGLLWYEREALYPYKPYRKGWEPKHFSLHSFLQI